LIFSFFLWLSFDSLNIKKSLISFSLAEKMAKKWNGTLHAYATEGDIEGIQRLLDQGKDVNQTVRCFFFVSQLYLY
jgi:hypothetical protein